MFDTDCLHTPYLPPVSSSSFRSPALKPAQPIVIVPEVDLLNLNDPTSKPPSVPSPRKEPKRRPGFSTKPGERERGKHSSQNGARMEEDGLDSEDEWEEEEWVPDVFLFEYGTVVIWGMTEKEEKAFLKSL
jgi:uncharacterized Rmd1/YagE family protein